MNSLIIEAMTTAKSANNMTHEYSSEDRAQYAQTKALAAQALAFAAIAQAIENLAVAVREGRTT